MAKTESIFEAAGRIAGFFFDDKRRHVEQLLKADIRLSWRAELIEQLADR